MGIAEWFRENFLNEFQRTDKRQMAMQTVNLGESTTRRA
jgi:hypothetical protein